MTLIRQVFKKMTYSYAPRQCYRLQSFQYLFLCETFIRFYGRKIVCLNNTGRFCHFSIAEVESTCFKFIGK